MARTCSRRKIKRVESIIPNRDFTVRASRETRKLKGRRNIHFFSRFSNSEFQCTIIIIFPESFLHRSFSRCFFHSHEKKNYILSCTYIFAYIWPFEALRIFFFMLNFIFFLLIILLFFSRINLYRAFTLIWSNLYVCIFVLKEKKKIRTNLKIDLNLDVIFYNKKKWIFVCYHIL